jgi:molybdopterin adenylyltransferase
MAGIDRPSSGTSSSTPGGAASPAGEASQPSRPVRIGLVSISDRASTGVYEDKGIPSLLEWLGSAITSQWEHQTRLIPDERETISATLVELVDRAQCDLVLTTGGTGPSRRDVTPEATLAVASKEMPGFGEQMRQISLRFVPTAILSRQVGAIREIDGHAALIVNLPGQPKSIRETLEGLRDAQGASIVPGIFAAIPYCIDLIGGPYIETDERVVKAFRPKKK